MTDLLLFYVEYFYGFLESDLWKCWKKTFISQQTYLYIPSQTFWSFMAIYFVHIVTVFVSLKTVIMLIFLCICIKHSQHLEMRKNNSKLNFTKNRWASWFSCGWLKISKCSISLVQLEECSKSKVTPLHV